MTNCIACQFLTILLCFASGCGQSKVKDLPIVDGEPVPVRQTIEVGRVLSAGVHVIQTVDDFVELTGQPADSASRAFQSVDFTSESVVIAARGECSTTGYSIRIVGIALSEDVLNIYLREGPPRGNGPVGIAMTYPTHAIVVSKLPDVIEVISNKLADE